MTEPLRYAFEKPVGVNRKRVEVFRRGTDVVVAEGFAGGRLKESTQALVHVEEARAALARKVHFYRSARIWTECPLLGSIGSSELATPDSTGDGASEGVELHWSGSRIGAITVRDEPGWPTQVHALLHGGHVDTLHIDAYEQPDRWYMLTDLPLPALRELSLRLRSIRPDLVLACTPGLERLDLRADTIDLHAGIRHPTLKQLQLHAELFGFLEVGPTDVPALETLALSGGGEGGAFVAEVWDTICALPALRQLTLHNLSIDRRALGTPPPHPVAIHLTEVEVAGPDLDALIAFDVQLSGTVRTSKAALKRAGKAGHALQLAPPAERYEPAVE